MSNDLDAIREAVAALADEAHPEQRIRARLEARARAYRQRRLLLRLAGATAAVAATGGAALAARDLLGPHRRTTPPTPPTGHGDFPGVSAGPGGGWARPPVQWGPGWLPDRYGLVAVEAVGTGDRVTGVGRRWSVYTQPLYERKMLGLYTGPFGPFLRDRTGDPQDVDINGVPGRLAYDERGLTLTWQPAGEPELTVTAFDDADMEAAVERALQFARSLQRDQRTVAVGPRFAGSPAWHFTLTVDTIALHWLQVLESPDVTRVTMGPGVGEGLEALGGHAQTRVRGTDAWLLNGVPALLVKFGDYSLTADAPAPDVVESMDLGPVPSVDWFGER
ncbi:hypothetical protein [Dactylosporangium salmoneum]|uniref:Uncharacterized protein n=1 Tax=Dactylosporangium salmoneum TaxID=53361 RepID=A0ABP5TCG8_9ACTN